MLQPATLRDDDMVAQLAALEPDVLIVAAYGLILPQAVPALTAVSLFHFFFAWNDFFNPLIFLAGNRDIVPIAVGLNFFNGTYVNQPNLIMAASFIALIIPLAIFFFSQRIFLSGIVVSGAEK